MTSLIPVSIVIGDRSYRIKVEPKDEEVVRKTVKIINDKILEFKTQFAGKDMQDYVSMVLIWYATELSGKVAPGIDAEHLSEKLAALDRMLTEHLEEAADLQKAQKNDHS